MQKTPGITRGIPGLLLGVALSLLPLPAAAEVPEPTAYSGAVGIGAALGTLIYAPLKLTYALTGSLIGGMAWIWTGGDSEVATPIVHSAIKGDYVISPAHIEGERPIEFHGSKY